jgi:hypothetical protein
MARDHEVIFACDQEMPDGHNWMLLEVDGEVFCVIRRSHVKECVLEDAWAGYRHLAAVS